jgi:hypothetical protein
MGSPVSVEILTYVELADRLGCSPEAARSLSRRLRLSRRPGNDGRVRITVDLTEIQYKPLPARLSHGSNIEALNAQIERLEGEVARLEVEKQCLEVCAVGHRADFECERTRCDMLMTETLKLNEFAMWAREKAARLEGELSAASTRHRWWRLAPETSRPTARLDLSRRSPVLVGVPVRI